MSIIKELVNIKLPEELKKAERSHEGWGIREKCLPSLVVASFLEKLKKKIDANLTKEMRRLFAIEKRYKKTGDFTQERNYRHCGMTLGINAKREVREAFRAVFGGEGK